MAAKRKAAKSKRPVRVRKAPAARRPAVRKAPAQRAAPRTNARAAAARALRLAGVGSEAVLRATGRAWDEWLKVLDRAGAKKMPHKDIALMLSRQFAVPNWWSQMVTVGYEQARGLREAGQNTRGFSTSVSRTVGVPVGRLYDAWSDARMRSRWLLDAPVEVRRVTDGRSIRMTWTVGASSIDVGFYPKGEGRSQVAVAHGKLKDGAAAARQKRFWGDALDRLKALLEPVA